MWCDIESRTTSIESTKYTHISHQTNKGQIIHKEYHLRMWFGRKDFLCFIIVLSSTMESNKSIADKQFLSNLLTKFYQNPSSTSLNPLYPNTNYILVNKKPLFSLQIKPEHQLQKEQFLNGNPFTTFYTNDHLQDNNFNSFHNFLNNNHQFKQLEQTLNRRNQLFYNRVGLLNENKFQNDPLDPALDDQNRQPTGHWCNKQMQHVLQPYCFCSQNRLTKNTIICSNLPSEHSLKRTLYAASIFLNLEGIYRINKLKIFNSSLNDLNVQTFPKTLNFLLIQMNKCDLLNFNQFTVFQNSVAQLKKLDLSYNELEEFPFNELYQLNDLLILKLSYNHLNTIDDNALKGCNKLKMLDLSFNKISYLGNYAFKDALNLKILDLSFNQLKVLNNYALAFHPSSTVHLVNLANNQMRYVADQAFENLIVHKLYLNNNRLRKFNKQLFEPILINMAKINLEQNIFFSDRNEGYEVSYRNGLNVNKTYANETTDYQVDTYIDIYKAYLNDSSDFSFNQTLIKNFRKRINFLVKLNLTSDLMEDMIVDLMEDASKSHRILDKKNSRSVKEVLDASNSFREEINTNKSVVYFDDEPDQKDEKPYSTFLNYENDDSAFILSSDNNFQCDCPDFEWLFKLKKNELRSLKGFQCSNLIGQKKFLYLERLTLQDLNCWNLY